MMVHALWADQPACQTYTQPILKYNCSGSKDGALVGKVCKEFISYQPVK